MGHPSRSGRRHEVLYARFSADPTNRRRFEAEARAAASLNHPNIVAVHDYGEHDGAPYIVMERLPGNTLADAIAQGPMPQQALRGVLVDVLAALTAAHDVGILHRDVKPGNILFTASGHVKVADFGIAKTAGSEPTATGQIMGTMGYVSPDRLEGKPATVLDDVHSVGVLGYEALTGRPPFRYDNMGALARAILAERPAPIPALRPDADPILVAAIDRAMTRDALHRFQSARQMREALSNWQQYTRPLVAGPPVAAVRPPTMVLTSPPPPAATCAPMPCRPPTEPAEPETDVDGRGRGARPAPRRHPDLRGLSATDAATRDDEHAGPDDGDHDLAPPPPTASEVVERPGPPEEGQEGPTGKKGKGEGHGGN